MNDGGQVAKKLREIRAAYDDYKVAILRLLLFALLLLMLSAQIFPPVADFIIQKKFFTFAVVLGVLLTLFDVILSHGQSRDGVGHPPVLGHFSDLREYLREAFESEVVELNIAAYSGETFYNVLSEFLQDVAEGRRQPKRLHVRLLVPDCSAPMTVPCMVDTLEEATRYKESIQLRNRRFEGEFQNHFNDIQRRTRLTDAQLEIKTHRLDPVFKMIIINNCRGFFALYPIAETAVELSGETLHLWDYRGERARFIGFAADGGLHERELFITLNEWFRTVWYRLSTTVE